MTTAVKIFHDYKANASEMAVYRDDGKSVGCLTLARKAKELGVKTLSFMEALRFAFIDLLSYIPFCGKRQFQVLQSEILPNLNKKIDEINEWAKKNFNKVESNVPVVEDAKVICLGETHISSRHRRNNGHLIDLLASKSPTNKDLALVEGVRADFPTPSVSQTAHVKTPISIRGWDDMDHNSQSRIAIHRMIQGAGTAILSRIGSSPTTIGLALGTFLIFNSTAQINHSLIPRNRSLCKTIDQNEKSHSKIFALTGSGHLKKSSSTGNFIAKLLNRIFHHEWSNPQNTSVEETLSHLRSKQFAVLVPKRFI